jgi:hypothetical protein
VAAYITLHVKPFSAFIAPLNIWIKPRPYKAINARVDILINPNMGYLLKLVADQ